MSKAPKKQRKLKFAKSNFILYRGDALKVLGEIDSDSIECIFTDPPYFLSNGGVTCSSGKFASVNKGDWDKLPNALSLQEFNRKWLTESLRVLKDGGTLWVSGTYHNIYTIGAIIASMPDFKILNNITWQKLAPPPNLACRYFTHSTETILWVRKGQKSKHYFDYPLMKAMNNGKQMKDVWRIGRPKKNEKIFGKHPTQKPEELLERIILASTRPGERVLDMFAGSSTTGAVCLKHKRFFIGIEKENEYYKLSKQRLMSIQKNQEDS